MGKILQRETKKRGGGILTKKEKDENMAKYKLGAKNVRKRDKIKSKKAFVKSKYCVTTGEEKYHCV